MNKTGNHNLKKQEINIYREIQRNTEMAMKALDAVTDKIYDDRLAAVVAEQELQYSRLHDRAVQNLVENLLFALLEDTPNRRKISQMTMTLLFLLLCGHTETMTFVPMA